MGMDLINSGLDFHFKSQVPVTQICSNIEPLNEAQVKLFRYAILNNYWFTAYIDDLPIGGYVGERRADDLYLYTHKAFHLKYNGERIVSANVTMQNPVLLEWKNNPVPIKFTYSIEWVKSSEKFENRFDKYLDSDFFEHKVQCLLCLSWCFILDRFISFRYSIRL